jgi:hypothetical protein
MNQLIRHATLTLTFITTCAMLAAPAFAMDAYAPTVLTPATLKTNLVGNTVHYVEDGDDVYEYYNPNGTIYGDSKKYGKYTAKWTIRDDGTFCFFYDDPESSGCVFVVRQPTKITYFRYLEDTEGPYDFINGNPKKM